jgi:hypothetical protein
MGNHCARPVRIPVPPEACAPNRPLGVAGANILWLGNNHNLGRSQMVEHLESGTERADSVGGSK